MTGDRRHRLRVEPRTSCLRTQSPYVQPPLIPSIEQPKNGVTCPRGCVSQQTGTPVAASAARGFSRNPVEGPLPVMPIASPPPFPLLA